jgi:hypothetical protein
MRIHVLVELLGCFVTMVSGMCTEVLRLEMYTDSRLAYSGPALNMSFLDNMSNPMSLSAGPVIKPPVAQLPSSAIQNETHAPFIGRKQCLQRSIEWSAGHSKQNIGATSLYTLEQFAVFETTESFGKGRYFTECDGVPRFHMTEPPTSWSRRFVSISRTETVLLDRPKLSKPYMSLYEYVEEHPLECGGTKDWWKKHPQIYDRTNLTEQEWCIEAYDKHMPKHNAELLGENAAVLDRLNKEAMCKEDCEFWFKDELVLLYWPPQLENRDICAADGYGNATTLSPTMTTSQVAVLNAITFAGQDLYWKHGFRRIRPEYNGVPGVEPQGTEVLPTRIGSSVLSGPFTLTYPTLYIAHHDVITTHGNRGNKMVLKLEKYEQRSKTIKRAGIIALHSSDLYSMEWVRPKADGRSPMEFVKDVAAGRYNRVERQMNQPVARPFNLAHLQEPVPASVYFAARYRDCWGQLEQTHCSVITAGHYRPRLSLPAYVLESAFGSDFSSCTMPALIDPPLALSPIVGAHTLKPLSITRNTQETKTSFLDAASPGNTAESPWPAPTGRRNTNGENQSDGMGFGSSPAGENGSRSGNSGPRESRPGGSGSGRSVPEVSRTGGKGAGGAEAGRHGSGNGGPGPGEKDVEGNGPSRKMGESDSRGAGSQDRSYPKSKPIIAASIASSMLIPNGIVWCVSMGFLYSLADILS